jgi:hypothetical protein
MVWAHSYTGNTLGALQSEASLRQNTTFYLNNSNQKMAEGMARVVEHLPSKCEFKYCKRKEDADL